jgi:NADH dehydrogenase
MNSSTIEGDSQIDNIKIDSIHTIGSEENNVPDNESNIVYEYSIENEVALKQFINIINEKDRGIPPEPFFDVGGMIEQLIGKIFDTVEDASLMFRRNFAEYSTDANALSEWNDINQCHKPRVLVIGSGWASHAFIKCIDNELFRVLVVSPTNYFVFTPMLASSSVGTTEIRSIVESIRDSNPTVKFLEGKGLDINTEAKTLKVEMGEGDIIQNDFDSGEEKEIIEIPYDIAIYASGVGPISSSKHIPGLSPQNVHFLKSTNDARRLRSAIIDLLEKASQPNLSDEERRKLLTFIVTGGGPTGVELTGELTDFLNDVTGNKHSRSGRRKVAPFNALAKYISIKLIQGGKDLLPMFDEYLRESAKTTLEKAGVEVMISTRVDQIQSREMIVVTNDYGENQNIRCGIIVWAAGTKPVQLTEKLLLNLDESSLERGFSIMPSSMSERGRIPVDRWQRALGARPGSILAIGDASGTVGENASPLPQTAQVAAQQGAFVARLLNRGYDLSGDSSISHMELPGNQNNIFLPPPINHEAQKDDIVKNKLRGHVTAKPFQFLNLGQLAYTGGGEALSQVELGNKKLFSQAGSVGYLLWKSVYVVKQVSPKSRILVLFDWCKTKIFGRDVTRM